MKIRKKYLTCKDMEENNNFRLDLDFSRVQDPFVEVYDPQGNLVIKTNDEKIFLYICCQIKDAHVSGYYVVVPDEIEKLRETNPAEETKIYPIDIFGRVKGLGAYAFRTHGELLRKLI